MPTVHPAPKCGGWCTPSWIWRIPLDLHRRRSYDLDPFSSPHATVPATSKLDELAGFDSIPWPGHRRNAPSLIWFQPPYTTRLLRDGAALAADAARRGAYVWGVVPCTSETVAWVRNGPSHGVLLGRVQFVPPPGVKQSHPDNREIALVVWADGICSAELVRRAAVRLTRVRERPHYTIARVEERHATAPALRHH